MFSIKKLNTSIIFSVLLTASAVTFATTEPILFSPYKDTSINMNWNTNIISTRVNGQSVTVPLLGDDQTPSQLLPGNKAVTLAFATGTCESENWGGVPGDTLAAANIPLFVTHNMNYIISTGGAAGTFLCDSATDMTHFLSRYQSKNLVGLDFDIEGGYTATQLNTLMAATVAAIQNLGLQNKLRVSLTVATLASSSTINTLGEQAIQAAQAAGLNFNVNLMVMDYGDAGCQKNNNGQCDMAASAIYAARKFSEDYHIPLNRIELTPMIAENDTAGETTTLADALTIATFVRENQLAGLHYWSFDRDTACAQHSNWASPICNSVSTAPLQYDAAFLQALSVAGKI